MTLQDIIDRLVGDLPEDDAGRSTSAATLVENCGYISAAVALIPLPGTEFVGILPVHLAMVMGIGRIYGEELTQESANEILVEIGATVGVSILTSKVATTVAKTLLPGFGGLVGAPIIFVNTLAIGSVARNWFVSRGQMTEEEMKEVYREAARRAKQTFDPSKVKQARAAAEEVARAAADDAPSDPVDASEDVIDVPFVPPPDSAAEPVTEPLNEPATAAAPDPEPEPATAADPAPADITARLFQLKSLLELGLIDAEEFAATKQRILSEL